MANLIFLPLLIILSLFVEAQAAVDNFVVKPSREWSLVDRSANAQIYFRNNSTEKETVVLRTFDANQAFQERASNFQNNLRGVLNARNLMFKKLGLYNPSINEVLWVQEPKYTSDPVLEVKSTVKDRAGARWTILERQYFFGNKIYQVVYSHVQKDSSDNKKRWSLVTEHFRPNIANRSSASETKTSAPRASRTEAKLADSGATGPQERQCDAQIKHAEELKTDRLAKGRSRVADLLGYCAYTIASSIGEGTIIGLAEKVRELVGAVAQYATNSLYREQTNAAVGMVASIMVNDPVGLSWQLSVNVYNSLAAKIPEFLCMNLDQQIGVFCQAVGIVAQMTIAPQLNAALLGPELSAAFEKVEGLLEKTEKLQKIFELAQKAAEQKAIAMVRSVKKVKWAGTEGQIAQAVRSLESGNVEQQKKALEFFDKLRVEVPASNDDNLERNKHLSHALENLAKYMHRSASAAGSVGLQKKVATVISRFVGVNSDIYKNGVLARIGPNQLEALYSNPKFSDEARRILHSELSLAAKIRGETYPEFQARILFRETKDGAL